jgi:uncharacterized protein
MASQGLDAFFIDGALGRLFCLLHLPAAGVAVRGAVVYLPPFAEEMNKSRRMAALQARALAAGGWWVLQPDLFGCGDSEGDFADASWDGWIDDAMRAARWLGERSGCAPALWGLRAGCLLAGAVANAVAEIDRLMFWQPVVSGKLHLQQFLRLKVASGMLGEGKAGGDGTRQMREQLLAGQAVEVAGYMLSGGVAAGLDRATLAAPVRDGQLSWFEVSGAEMPEITIASRQAIGGWQDAGWRVDAAALGGSSFWQTQEIEEVPALVGTGVAAMNGAAA